MGVGSSWSLAQRKYLINFIFNGSLFPSETELSRCQQRLHNLVLNWITEGNSEVAIFLWAWFSHNLSTCSPSWVPVYLVILGAKSCHFMELWRIIIAGVREEMQGESYVGDTNRWITSNMRHNSSFGGLMLHCCWKRWGFWEFTVRFQGIFAPTCWSAPCILFEASYPAAPYSIANPFLD